jgi:hypothetical protein
MKNYGQSNLAEEDKVPRPVSLADGFAVPCVAIALEQSNA